MEWSWNIQQDIDPGELQLTEKVGEGGFGEVWRAVWEQKSDDIITTTQVAVKKLVIYGVPTETEIKSFEKEVVIAAQLKNPHVINVYGVCICSNEIWMVMELAESNLFSVLADYTVDIPWTTRWKWAQEVAAAVEFLHIRGIVHRDIKSLNFLLVHGQVKITDFGMSTAIALASPLRTLTGVNENAIGTARWLAPESTARKPVMNEKSDIYSLGIVLWEIASREIPFKQVATNAQVIALVKYESLRPEIPYECPNSFASIFQQCWQSDPDDRPTATQVLEYLKTNTPFFNASPYDETEELHIIFAKDNTIDKDDFELEAIFNETSSAKTMHLNNKYDGKKYIMKVLRKDSLVSQDKIPILHQIKHPLVVDINCAFHNTDKLYIIHEFISGCDLLTCIKNEGHFTENHALFYGARIVCILEHFHSLGIIPCNLKPEAFLVDSTGNICATDFGLCNNEEFEHSAPEQLKNNGNGMAVDWWLLGTLLFEMMTGLPPFHSTNANVMYHKILHAELQLPDSMSNAAKSLLIGLLTKEPSKRLGYKGVSEVKNHAWFADIAWEKLCGKEVEPPFIPKLSKNIGVNKSEIQKQPSTMWQHRNQKVLEDSICGKLYGTPLLQFAKQIKVESALHNEVICNLIYREELLKVYVSRAGVQQKILDYLRNPLGDQVPTLVIQAPEGAGKTAVMAWASRWVAENMPFTFVITRFIGSLQSNDVLSLLQSLCAHMIELQKFDRVPTEKHKRAEENSVIGKSIMQLARMLQTLLKETTKSQQQNAKLVIFLDSLDQLRSAYSEHKLNWLPLIVPSHVRIIVSTSTELNTDFTEQLHALAGGSLTTCIIEEITPIVAEEMLQQLLSANHKTLTYYQKKIFSSAFKASPSPLYLQIAATISQEWNWWTPQEKCILEEGMKGIINQFLCVLEKKHGTLLVARALSYLIESRNGLSSEEMENVLLSDEDIVNDIYEWWTPATCSVPIFPWKKVKDGLGKLVTEKTIHGVKVLRLSHPILNTVVVERYINSEENRQQIAIHLTTFFCEKSITPPFNFQMLSELPFLHVKSGLEYLHDSLLSFEFILAKILAGMLDELDGDYETALSAISQRNTLELTIDQQQIKGLLTQVQSFLRRKRHIISRSPNDTLAHALNEPDSTAVRKLAFEYYNGLASRSKKVVFWRLNKNQTVDPCILTISNQNISCCCFGPYDSTLVAGTYDGEHNLKLLSSITGQEILVLGGHTNEVTCCLVTRDGSQIISGSADGTVRIWNSRTGCQLRLFQLSTTKWVRCIAVTSDNRKLVCGLTTETQVLDLTSGKILHTYNNLGLECAVSPDDKLVMLTTLVRVTLYELDTGSAVLDVSRHYSSGFAFLSSTCLMYADGHILKMWDRKSNVIDFANQFHMISSCAVNGQSVVVAASGWVRVWDLTTRFNTFVLIGNSPHIPILKVDNNRILSVSNGTGRLFDISLAQRQYHGVGRIAFCKLLKRFNIILAIIRFEGQAFEALDISNGNVINRWSKNIGNGYCGDVSEDGQMLAEINPPNNVCIWNLVTEKIHQQIWHADRIHHFHLSPSCTKIVTYCEYPPIVRIWDVSSCSQLCTIDAEHDVRVEFIDDNKLLYSKLAIQCNGDTPSEIKILDIETQKPLSTFEFFMDVHFATQVRKDIIVLASDIQLKVWDISIQRTVFEFFHDTRHNIIPVLTDDTLFISNKGGVVQIIQKKRKNEKEEIWEERERCVMVDREITGMCGKENKLMVICDSDEYCVFIVTGLE